MNASQWLDWLQRAASYTLHGVLDNEDNNELLYDMVHMFNSIGKKTHLRSELKTLRELTITTLANGNASLLTMCNLSFYICYSIWWISSLYWVP